MANNHRWVCQKVTRWTIFGNERKKSSSGLGAIGTSVFLVLVGVVGCDYILAVIFLSLSIGFMGFQSSGSLISHLDIASNYAGQFRRFTENEWSVSSDQPFDSGTLVGITNMFASVPGFVGPMFVGWITNNNVRETAKFCIRNDCWSLTRR